MLYKLVPTEFVKEIVGISKFSSTLKMKSIFIRNMLYSVNNLLLQVTELKTLDHKF